MDEFEDRDGKREREVGMGERENTNSLYKKKYCKTFLFNNVMEWGPNERNELNL